MSIAGDNNIPDSTGRGNVHWLLGENNINWLTFVVTQIVCTSQVQTLWQKQKKIDQNIFSFLEFLGVVLTGPLMAFLCTLSTAPLANFIKKKNTRKLYFTTGTLTSLLGNSAHVLERYLLQDQSKIYFITLLIILGPQFLGMSYKIFSKISFEINYLSLLVYPI